MIFLYICIVVYNKEIGKLYNNWVNKLVVRGKVRGKRSIPKDKKEMFET